ncbi:MAG: ABC transporter permease [Clostridia bacterium]|nr:ABC transporter permease [Clostridia bacterium]
MTAIFKREFKAFFATPVGYIVLAAFYLFSGYYFTLIYTMGSPEVQNIIMTLSTVIVFVTPLLTMRLMSDDKRMKTDQALLTAPVSLYSIVLGKFLAALAVYALGFAPTIIFEFIVLTMVEVNVLSYLYALLGAILLGAALIAIGMFISSLTESSVVSAILTFVINILIIYASSLGSMIDIGWVATVIEKIAFITAFENFGSTVFSIPDVFYFLSITAAFLFLSVRSLEKRRWA